MRWGVKGILIAIVIAAVLVLCVALSLIAGGAKSDAAGGGDYMVILGCGLDGAAPGKCLLSRLDTALAYLNENTGTTVIVSGGQGNNEDVTEAQAMETYLVQHGISADRIIQENRSHSTYQNLVFSKEILDDRFGPGEKRIVLVSNDFHLYRAKFMAERLGYFVTTLSAPTPPEQTLPNWAREICTVLVAWIQFLGK